MLQGGSRSWKSELGELEIQSSGSSLGSWSGAGYREDFTHLLQGLSERPKRKDLRLNPGSKGNSKMIDIGGHWRSVTQPGAEGVLGCQIFGCRFKPTPSELVFKTYGYS